MKNKMSDLRNHLFETLEVLKDAKSEDLEREIARARAVGAIASQVIESAKVEVEFIEATGADLTGEFFDDSYRSGKSLPAPDRMRLTRGA